MQNKILLILHCYMKMILKFGSLSVKLDLLSAYLGSFITKKNVSVIIFCILQFLFRK